MWKYCGIEEHSIRDSDQKHRKTKHAVWTEPSELSVPSKNTCLSVVSRTRRWDSRRLSKHRRFYLLDGAYHAVYPTDPIYGQKAAGPHLIPKQKHSSILPPLLRYFILWSEWRCHQTLPVKSSGKHEGKKNVYFFFYLLLTCNLFPLPFRLYPPLVRL